MANKKGKVNAWTAFITFAVLLTLGFSVAFLGMSGAQKQQQIILPQSGISGNTDTGVTLSGKNVCTGGASTSFDRDHYDRLNPSTAFTDPEIYRELNSEKWVAGTEGTAVAAPSIGVGRDYGFVSGISLSDFVDEAYGPYQEYRNIECGARIDVESMDNEAETALTATWYNEADNAAGQTMVANTDYEVEVRMRASSENVFGNPYLDSYKALGFGDKGDHRMDFPNTLTLHLNVTGMDIPDYVKVTGTTGKLTFENGKWIAGKQVLSSEPMHKIPCPDRASTEHGSATSTHYCYELPVIGDNELVVILGLDADNTIAPVVDDTGYMYAAGIFVNDAGVLDWGVETDMGADVANDDADSVTLDYTA